MGFVLINVLFTWIHRQWVVHEGCGCDYEQGVWVMAGGGRRETGTGGGRGKQGWERVGEAGTGESRRSGDGTGGGERGWERVGDAGAGGGRGKRGLEEEEGSGGWRRRREAGDGREWGKRRGNGGRRQEGTGVNERGNGGGLGGRRWCTFTGALGWCLRDAPLFSGNDGDAPLRGRGFPRIHRYSPRRGQGRRGCLACHLAARAAPTSPGHRPPPAARWSWFHRTCRNDGRGGGGKGGATGPGITAFRGSSLGLPVAVH